jgi:hypothetical protein
MKLCGRDELTLREVAAADSVVAAPHETDIAASVTLTWQPSLPGLDQQIASIAEVSSNLRGDD